jgi:sugar/nucleoside kinase (ribokinase family)
VDLVHGNVRELNQFADSEDLNTTLRQITAWGAGAIIVHMGADGAGYYHKNGWTVSPAIPVRQHKNTAGTGDLLSVCLMLLHGREKVPLRERLYLANTIVSEFIEGKRGVIPVLE